MIIGLFALAFAMIVGGLFAAILGWDIVLVERGWTMVIAGSISAASGALLLGVTAVVSKLSRIQGELMRIQANLVEDAAEELPATATAAGLSVAALGGGLFARKEAETGAAPGESRELPPPALEADRSEGAEVEPTTEPEPQAATASAAAVPSGARWPFGASRAGRAEASPPEEAPSEDVPAVRIPDFLLAERSDSARGEAPEPGRWPHAVEREPDLRTAANDVEPVQPVADEEDVFEPRREPEPRPEARDEDMLPEEAPEEAASEAIPESAQAATVIGSYTSGENKYVMYSDGSIEADTPQGRFRFGSLDDLKRFIATGEGGTRIT